MIISAGLLFQVLKMDETDENILALNGSLILAPVHTGKVDAGTPATRLVEINPGAVEASEIIDHSRHKLKGVVDLQVE